MSARELTVDLAAWALQIGLLVGVGLLLPALLRCRAPRLRLLHAQGLLLAVLLLPVVQLWRGVGLGVIPGEAVWVEAVAFAEPGEPGAAGDLPFQAVLWTLGLGALARLLWLGTGLRRLRSLRGGAEPLSSLTPALADLAGRMGAAARFYLSDEVEGPVTFGWRRPAVLLPSSFPELPEAAQRGIACHELLHVRRRDWLLVLCEEGVRSLLWFHPLVWLLLRRLALHREQVVDGEVVRITGERRPYLEALLGIAAGREGRAGWPASPSLTFHHRGHLRERVAALTKEVSMSRSRVFATATTLVAATAVAAILGGTLFPMTAFAADSPAAEKAGALQPAKVVHQVPADYPESARKKRIQGPVAVEVLIDPNGRVQETRVVRSLDPGLDKAAADALSQWRFQPARLDGKPVKSSMTFTIQFSLEKEKNDS